MSIEYRSLGDRLSPTPEVVADFVRTNVDVIVAYGAAATLSAKEATSKRFALIKETVPRASRVDHLWSSMFPGTKPYLDEMVAIRRNLHCRHLRRVAGL